MRHSDAPWKALKRAEEALGKLKANESPEANADSWQDFLIHIERTWNRTHDHFRKSPKWSGWRSKYEKQRKDDPLLSYVRHARNADEHTTQPITATGHNIAINPVGSDVLHLKNFHVGKDGVRFESRLPVSVKIFKGEARAIEVTDRDVLYKVPYSHLGTAFEPKLATMAELTFAYYRDALTATEAEFVK